MVRAQHDPEMSQQLPWEKRDDVHSGIDGETRDDTKARNRVTKCEFTVGTATLGWRGSVTVVPAEGNA